jgi:hypothetical protein
MFARLGAFALLFVTVFIVFAAPDLDLVVRLAIFAVGLVVTVVFAASGPSWPTSSSAPRRPDGACQKPPPREKSPHPLRLGGPSGVRAR